MKVNVTEIQEFSLNFLFSVHVTDIAPFEILFLEILKFKEKPESSDIFGKMEEIYLNL